MERRIPVVVIGDVKETDKICRALKASGINTAEITFRTPCAADAIRYAASAFPEMEIGAGTVINAEQCERAIASGARFVVSPGFSSGVADVCRAAGVPYYPGCATPTEIMAAVSAGFDVVKFFPAEAAGGLKYIKSIAAPYVDVTFMPTGVAASWLTLSRVPTVPCPSSRCGATDFCADSSIRASM